MDNSIQATSPKIVEAVGKLAEEGRARQLLMSREDELALLAVEDPVGYERHLLSEDAESQDDPPPDE